jgi:hypothetical protein
MELMLALGIPAIVLFGLTLLFKTEGLPAWMDRIHEISSTTWTFGIIALSVMSIVVYFSQN